MNEMNDQQSHDHSAIDIPEGLSREWIIGKAKHLNAEFAKWSETWMPTIDDNYKLFEGQPIGGMRPGAIPLPIPNSIIETLMARFMSAINGREKLVDAIQKERKPDMGPPPGAMPPMMGQPPMMGPPPMDGPPPMEGPAISPMGPPQMVKPPEPEGDILVVEDLVNESLTQTPDFMDKVDELFKLLLLETVGVVEVFWDNENITERKILRNRAPAEGVFETGEEYSETERKFPNFMPESIRGLAWSPREKWNIGKSPWIRRRSKVNLDQLMELEEAGIIEGVDMVIENVQRSDSKDTKKDPDAARSKNVEGKDLPSINFNNAEYQLDEWWATLVWKNQGQLQKEEFRFWLIEDKELVKFEVNPLKPKRKPFFSVKLNRKPGMFMARGPMDVIKPLLVDIANAMESKNTLIRETALTPTFVEPSAGLDIRKNLLAESSIIPVLNVRGIQRSEPPAQAIAILDAHIRFLIGQAKEATSANDLSQGTGSASADTATEAKILEAGAATRFQYNFEMVMNGIFAPMAKEYFRLYKQMIEDGKVTVNQSGVDGRSVIVTLEDLQGDYEFKAVASQAVQNRMGRFKLLEEILVKTLEATSKNPDILRDKDGTPMKVSPYEFITQQMFPLVDVKGSGGLFRHATPQEIQMDMMQKQMAMMAQGGAPNPNAPGGPPMSGKTGPAVLPGAE